MTNPTIRISQPALLRGFQQYISTTWHRPSAKKMRTTTFQQQMATADPNHSLTMLPLSLPLVTMPASACLTLVVDQLSARFKRKSATPLPPLAAQRLFHSRRVPFLAPRRPWILEQRMQLTMHRILGHALMQVGGYQALVGMSRLRCAPLCM